MAEATDVNYDIIHDSSDIVKMMGSEYLWQMRQPRPPEVAAQQHWVPGAEAEMATIRAEAEAEEHARLTAEHRLAEALLKAEAADRILVGQMKNRLGFVDKLKEVVDAYHQGYVYVPDSSESGSYTASASDEQASSPAPPPPAAAPANSGSVTGAAATVIVLSDDE